MSRFSVEAVFKAVDRFSRPIGRIESRMKGFSDSVEARNKNIGRSFRNLGLTVATSGTAMALGLGKVLQVGTEFEQAVVDAASRAQVFDRTDERFKMIGDEATRLGKLTEFSGSQVARGFQEFTAGGFEVADAAAVMRTQLDFASAAGIDLAKSVRTSVKALNIFDKMGLSGKDRAKELEDMQDFMAKISTQAPVSLLQISEALTKGAPLLAKAGVSFKSTLKTIALIGKSGITGTAAGTGAQNVIAKLLDATSGTGRAAFIFRDMGVALTEMVDGAEKLRDPLKIFQDIDKFFQNNKDKDRAKIFGQIFDKVGLKSALGLLQGVNSGFEEFEATMKDYQGTARQMAEFQRSTLGASFTKLESSIEGVANKMTSMSKGPIKTLVDDLTEFINLNGELIASDSAEVIGAMARNWELMAAGIVAAAVAIAPVPALIAAVTAGMINYANNLDDETKLEKKLRLMEEGFRLPYPNKPITHPGNFNALKDFQQKVRDLENEIANDTSGGIPVTLGGERPVSAEDQFLNAKGDPMTRVQARYSLDNIMMETELKKIREENRQHYKSSQGQGTVIIKPGVEAETDEDNDGTVTVTVNKSGKPKSVNKLREAGF